MSNYKLSLEIAKTKNLELIMEHAHSSDNMVVTALCKNPVTPLKALLDVYKHNDIFIARNAVINPKFPLKMVEDIIFGDYHSMMQIYAIGNPIIDEDTLIEVIKTKALDENNPIVNFLFYHNPNVTVRSLAALIAVWEESGLTPRYDSGLHLLVEGTKDLEILQFAVDNNILLGEVSSNKLTTEDMLRSIVHEYPDRADVMINVGRHKNASAEILEKLSHNPEVWARTKVALHKNSSIETLRYLSSDSELAVRKNVAKNKRTPKEVLEILKNDSSKVVKEAASKNLNS